MALVGFSAPPVDPKSVNSRPAAVRETCAAVAEMLGELSEHGGLSCFNELLAAKMELLYAQLSVVLGKNS